MAAMTIFERLNRGRPPAEAAIEQPSQEPAQLLLNWLQRWDKPTVSTKNICQFGPYSLRNGERALRSAQVLAALGWLAPLTAREWLVVRKSLVPTQ
jgi:hypothetical protein